MNNLDDEFPGPHIGVSPYGRSPVQVAFDEIDKLNKHMDNSTDKTIDNHPLLRQLGHMAKMETRINSLTDMLRELEWCGLGCIQCPICKEWNYDDNSKHKPDCRLSKLLNK